MIDRIEELLSEMTAEDDEEEQEEDVLAQKRGKAASEGAWTVTRASDGASGPGDQPEWLEKQPDGLTALQRDNGAAKPHVVNRRSAATEKRGAVVSSGPGSERSESGEAPEDRTAFAQPESLGRIVNGQSVTTEKRGAVVGSGPGSERSESGEAPESRTVFAQSESLGRVANRRGVTTGETTSERPGLMAGELRKIGPIWTALGGSPDTALEGMRRSGAVQSGLERLYRQTVQGLRPAAPALPPEQAGRVVRAQEPGSAASLAVDELDRAVRRDSRRYDGGMSIF